MVGVEHMHDAVMFSLSDKFYDLNKFVDDMRKENRAVMLSLVGY